METTIDSAIIEIEANAENSKNSLNSLSTTLDNLQAKITPTISKLSKLSEGIKSVSTIGSTNVDTKGLDNIISAIISLQNIEKPTNLKNALSQLERIPEISKKLNTKTISSFANKINEISNALVPLVNKLEKIGPILDKLPDKMNKVSASVQNMDQKTKNSKGFDNLITKISSLVKIGSLVAGIKLINNTIGKAIEKSNDYIENLNLFYVTLGKDAKRAKEFVDNFSEVLGLDPSNVMRYMATFNSLAKGFGISSDMAYTMSKNLTQLSYDMSSFLNIPIDQAMQKIKSGFSGEIEPMRAVGIALDQATLQQTAYTLGIKKQVSEMTRAQKTQLLYYQMMNNQTSQLMQKDMSRTLLQPANAIRVLKQQFTLLARAVGNIFIPVLTAVIPYLMVLTKWLTAAAQAIANLFGFKIDTSAWGDNLEGISGGIDDVADSAKGANKELKKMLAQFDELNVIDFGKNSGKGSGAGSGGLLDIPTYDYDALTGTLGKNLEAVEEKLKGILPVIAMIVSALLTIKGLSLLSSLTKFATKIGAAESVMKALGIATNVLKGTLAVLAGAIAGFAIGEFIDYISNGNQELEETIKAISIMIEIGGGLIALLTGNWLVALGAFGLAIGTLIQDMTNANNEVDIFRGSSEKTKEALQPTYDALKNINEELNTMYWDGLAPTDEQINTLKTNFDKIISEYKRVAAEQYNQQVAAIEARTDLTEKEKEEMLKMLREAYKDKIKEAEEDEKKYNEAVEKLRNANAEEYAKNLKTINDIADKYGKKNTEILATNEKETAEILKNYETEKSNIKKKEAAKYIQQSIEVKDKTIQAAKEEYNRTLSIAKSSYDDIMKNKENLTQDQIDLAQKTYDTAVILAEKQRDETIKAADEQYLGVIKKMREENAEVVDQVDLTTGKVRDFWDKLTTRTMVGTDEMYRELEKNGGNVEEFFKNTKMTAGNYISLMENNINDLSNTIDDNQKKLDSYNSTNMANSLKTISSEADKTKTHISGLISTIKKFPSSLSLKISSNAPTGTLKGYATGGYPTEGEMFLARENGPELIGRIGKKSAVANNDQIVDGIRQGVAQGVAEAMPSQQQRGATNVYIGNRKVYSGYGQYANQENNMYGTNVIKV